MNNIRFLNIKGAILETKQLENYLEKFGADHVITFKSDKQTYPIPRVKENYEFILKVYRLLNENVKREIPIHPAGEWILDNLYIIEETIKTIQKELTKKKYTNFVGIENGEYKGFARIYVLAAEIVAYTDGKFDHNDLADLLKAYQKKKTLNMDEIWNIGIFLQIALIEKIRQICEKIYNSQIQKLRVENMVDRFIEGREDSKIQYANTIKQSNDPEFKYPFIEHMSYKLKKYGKRAYSYLEILEEQVEKLGTDIDTVIKKEHFDIALKKISMKNSILGIRNISKIDFLNIFEKINGVEDVLKQDPSDVYMNMDHNTKTYYRNKIKEISKKCKVSEIYIAKKCLEFAQKEFYSLEAGQDAIDYKQTHIGYYLIDEGVNTLLDDLQDDGKTIKIKETKDDKVKLYITTIIVTTLVISFFISKCIYNSSKNIWISIILGLFFLVPIESAVLNIVQYILGKRVKPKWIPKMDYANGVPKKNSTMVVIPTIIKSKERVEDLIKNLEIYYMANKSENIYFTLLGDCSTSSKQEEEIDKELIKSGMEKTQELNKKYPKEGMPRFSFIYRNRIWSDSEQSYLGWERKRGMLCQFNNYLLGIEKDPFRTNTIQIWKEKNEKQKVDIAKIKYIITLDADTDLPLNAGIELIGSMSHILNTPILNEKNTAVIDGYAIMQPRVGIDLEISNKSIFTKIFAGTGGTDPYSTAVSDVYQDNFSEGIFTGKGIYDLDVFTKVLNEQIPDNTVLSHDLLEGNYLRCALVSDILLIDGYPSTYLSQKSRSHRWIRGDMQIIPWSKKKVKNKKGEIIQNPLGLLGKYKIIDNVIRANTEIYQLVTFMAICFASMYFNINACLSIALLLFSIFMPFILDLLNYIFCEKTSSTGQKTFNLSIQGLKGSFFRNLIQFMYLPDKAYMSFDAIVKSKYRMLKSKKFLLQWTTAEEAEMNNKLEPKEYYKKMMPNNIFALILFGISFIVYIFNNDFKWSIFFCVIGLLWIVAPYILFKISKPMIKQNSLELLNVAEKEYIGEVAKRTWKFFKEHLNEENNYLPPDNYQEDRKMKVAKRTSPTNIGLAMLCVISSYDLGYETIEDSIILLQNMLDTISKLQKWNGHLYNWYETDTLEPLYPRYVSSVDNGNYIGYLYVLRQFLNESKQVINSKRNQLENMIAQIDQIIDNTDFKVLYNEDNKLFSIGFNVEEGKLTDSYYDLLASEARQASIVAIAKKDISHKHWNILSRTLTKMSGYKGLISWAGTAFEYLMPNINIPTYEGSLLNESSKFLIMSQKEYSKKLGVTWGFSESAFNIKDLHGNYQYKSFGVPWLGLKRGLADDIVVSSYGSVMAINEYPKEVITNLRELEKEGMLQKYGFYESIDYTPNRTNKNEKSVPVKTYMAHHQGLILLSINNLFNKGILQKRFMNNPEIAACKILLQEKMPLDTILTKEKKEKVEKIKYKDYEEYGMREYNKINPYINHSNVISNHDYTIVMDQKGEGYSKYKHILINRYKQTSDENQGIFFFVKDIRTKRIWSNTYKHGEADKYKISFTPETNKITRTDGNIESKVQITTAPDKPVEIRRIELKNVGNQEEIIEVTGFLEPVLSHDMQDYSHMAFNNLFLKYEFLEDTNTILVSRNKKSHDEKETDLAVNFFTEHETIGDLEYEIDKEKLNGRLNLDYPEEIVNSSPFTKKLGLTTYPIIAMKRTIKIKPEETVSFNLVISIYEDRQIAIDNMKEYLNAEGVKRVFELSRARVETENRYLELTAKNIETYQKMLSYLIFKNQTRAEKLIDMKSMYPSEELYKFGISCDFPILLIKVKEPNDNYILKQILKAYEYFRTKNMSIELVIINLEKQNYENYVLEMIESQIQNTNLEYLKNQRTGIFVLNNVSKRDTEILEHRSSLIIDTKKGSIEVQLEEIEEQIKQNVKPYNQTNKQETIVVEEYKSENVKDMNKLNQYNEYGGFSKDGKEYIIKQNKENKLPSAWSNILANSNFGTVTTDSMGGYTWYRNSRLNRISSWSNNNVLDIPSEIIYLKDEETNKIWSLGNMPCPDQNDYYTTFGFGYTKCEHISSGIEQTLNVFVPNEDSVKVNMLQFKNLEPKKKKLKLIYYVKMVLGEEENKTNGYINLNYDSNSNTIFAKNLINKEFDYNMYISSSEKITSYTGDKKTFIGSSSLSNPDAVKYAQGLNFENSFGKSNMVAIEIPIEIQSYETKELSIVLGAEDDLIDCKDISYKYASVSNCNKEYHNTIEKWQRYIDKVQINTPSESMNKIINGWVTYQTLASRIFAKSRFLPVWRCDRF